MKTTVTGLEFDGIAARWGPRLSELATANGVPGAGLGVLKIGPANDRREQFVVASGLLNLDTALASTVDSVFHIGSITKIWTATVIMRLVEQGKIDLDAPLAGWLPALRLPDHLEARVTMRHLLTHTSGLDGDIFTDTGRGDDCLDRYVNLLVDADINHPLGATFSYCNAGYVLAGWIIEQVTGTTWDAAIREHLIGPLELSRTFTLPEECMLGRFAVGHVGQGPHKQHVAPVWTLPRSMGAAGLIACTTGDLLTFAALHLAGGQAVNGLQVLSPSTVTAMQQHEVELPDPYTLGDSWGLGWIRYDWDGHRVIGHDGNTIGQAAYLRIIPELGLAVSVFANGGEATDLSQAVFTEILAELAGISVPAPIEPVAGTPLDDTHTDTYVGRYARASLGTEVFLDSGRLMLRSTSTDPLAELDDEPVQEHELFAVRSPGVYAFRSRQSWHWTPAVFYRLSDGRRYLHYGARANPRVSE